MASTIMTTSSLPKTWARDFNEIFFDNYIKVPAQGNMFINESTVDGDMTHFVKKSMMVTMGPGKEMREGGAIPFDSFKDGPEKTVLPTKFGIALQATFESMRDDRKGIIKQGQAKIGESMKYTIELKQADLFNSAFTTARLGLDGKPLIAADHPNYGIGGGITYSNLITGSLSKTTLQAAIDKFTTMVDERGKPIIMIPEVLVIPPQLEWVAKNLLLSEYDPTNANQNVNPFTAPAGNSNFKGNLKYFVHRFLSSETAWFLLSSKATTDLQHYWFDKPTARTYVDDNTDNMIFKSTMRMATTFFNWRGVVGSTGV